MKMTSTAMAPLQKRNLHPNAKGKSDRRIYLIEILFKKNPYIVFLDNLIKSSGGIR
jgi:hypothetical protein